MGNCRHAVPGALLAFVAACVPAGMPKPVCVPPESSASAAATSAAQIVAQAPLSSAPTDGVYGALNEQIIARIKNVNLVDHVKLGFNANGALREVSIYHNDPQPIGPKEKQVIHHQFPGSQLITYETEWENDVGAITEATVQTPQGRICEVSMNANADVRYVECNIEASELPAEVREAALKGVPGGEIVECVYREEQRGQVYEVELRRGTVVHVWRLRSTGEVLERMIQLKARVLLAE